jgi:hypothetical protein
MPVSWMRDGNTLYGVVDGGFRRRIVVEPLPDEDGWDWISWRAEQAPELAVRGVARSVIDAMATAEVSVDPNFPEFETEWH